MNEFTLSDAFIIGFFTSIIGFRKYPIAKLDEMIETQVIDKYLISAIFVYLIISAIGGLIITGIISINTFSLVGIIANGGEVISKYSLLKTAVTLILSAIWYFSALRPVIMRLNTILERK